MREVRRAKGAMGRWEEGEGEAEQGRTGKIVVYTAHKVAQRRRVNIQLPLQVRAHLPLHLGGVRG
jgi:hypothetical protein